MAEKLVTIAEFADSSEADLARQLLDDFGIKSVLAGQHFAGMYPVPPLAKIELQTLESDAQKALEILQSRNRQDS